MTEDKTKEFPTSTTGSGQLTPCEMIFEDNFIQINQEFRSDYKNYNLIPITANITILTCKPNLDRLDIQFINKDDHKKLESLGWVRKDKVIDDIKCLMDTFPNEYELVIKSILKLLGDEDEGK